MNPTLKIEAMHEGKILNIYVRDWAKLTGKKYDTILFHRKQKLNGKEMTWEQVVGVEVYKPVMPKRVVKPNKEKLLFNLRQCFISKALTAQEGL